MLLAATGDEGALAAAVVLFVIPADVGTRLPAVLLVLVSAAPVLTVLLKPVSADPTLAVLLEPASAAALLLKPAESLKPAVAVPLLAVLLEPAFCAPIPVVLLPAAPARAAPLARL